MKMQLFEADDFDLHEEVAFVSDEDTGLRSIIAIHSTALGPALGGCRLWRYPSEGDALHDVLRLSRGMTFKSALAGLPHGGGKSVILLGANQEKSAELMHAFGRAVAKLGGRYIVGEDIGTTPEDMAIIRSAGGLSLGAPEENGGSGDCSPMTALGCFVSAEAVAMKQFGASNLAGLRVGVQGLGKVGGALCAMLDAAGAELVVADVDEARTKWAQEEFGATVAHTTNIHTYDMEIFAPCAFGAGLNDITIPDLKASAVVGAANNQLAGAHNGHELHDRGILFAPDYVVNAGGVIQLAVERIGGGPEEAERRTRAIARTLSEVFQVAEELDLPTNLAADRMAADRVRSNSGNYAKHQ